MGYTTGTKYDIDMIKEMFNEKDYNLVSTVYKNTKEKLDYICNKQKELRIQKVNLYSFNKNKCNCSKCASELSKKNWRNNHPKKEFDKNKYFEKYNKKVKNLVGNEYILFDIFKNRERIMLDLIHNDCEKHYIVEQNKFFKHNCRCQNNDCKYKRRSMQKMKSKEQVKQEVKDLVGNEYLLFGKYTGTNNNMIFKHNIPECNYEFQMTPHNFIGGNQRCPACAEKIRRVKLTKTQKQYEEEIFDRFGNEFSVVGKYVNGRTKISIKHNNCGHIFQVISSKIFYNINPCPYCERPTRGEQRIIDCLDSFMKDKYIYQQSYDDLIGINGGNLSYDFYLPQYNLLIEYQGEFHDGSVSYQTEEEFERQKEHDKRKREYAKSHGIDLLEIWYWDFDNIEDILYNYLKNKENKKPVKIKYMKVS